MRKERAEMDVFIILFILAAGCAGLFAARFFLLRRSLWGARLQMERINEEPGSNERLICGSPDKNLDALLGEINKELAASQAARVAAENREREFRRQISNISHDLRTPLTSILGYLELMEEVISERERAEYLSVVRNRAGALQSLIAEFYDLSRLEADEYQFEMVWVDLNASLSEALALFYHDFEKRGFAAEVSLAEELPLVLADESAVRRIFFNLLQNVLVHGKGKVVVLQRQEGSAVVTCISNESEDLAQEDLERVFERFFTADEMRSGQNTGLGMTITKKLLEKMGHEISARLERQKGQKPVFKVEIRWKAENGSGKNLV